MPLTFLQIKHGENRIPRGELWFGHGLFQGLGREDNLETRLRLCQELTMDITFLPASISPYCSPLFNYRYFTLEEIKQAIITVENLAIGVIIDGPFQRLVHKEGFQSFMLRWRFPELQQILVDEAAQVSQLVYACLECKPHTLIIADDIAYRQSTLVNVNDLEQHLFVFYRDWIKEAHRHGIPVFFHSDGNLTGALPGLITTGFDGLAGCELECQDIPALKREYGQKLIFITGIPAELMECAELNSNHREEFIKLVVNLNSGGNFILGSSAGLASARQFANLKILYRWADEIVIQK